MKGTSLQPAAFEDQSIPVSYGNAVKDSSLLAVSSTVRGDQVIVADKAGDVSVDQKVAKFGNLSLLQVCSMANDSFVTNKGSVAGAEIADKKLETSENTISILDEVFGPSDCHFQDDDLEHTCKNPSANILKTEVTEHISLETEAQRGKEVERDIVSVHKSGVIGEFEPKIFLADIKYLAKDALGHSAIDSTVTKNRLSAFYRILGQQQVPMEQLIMSTHVGSSVSGQGIVSTIPEPKSNKRKRSKSLDYGSVKAQDIVKDVKSEKGHESRERRKSKYLQPPYVNLIGSGVPKNVLAVEEEEIEELKEDSSLADSSGKKSQNKSKKRFNDRGLSLNPNILNASSAEMLSQLHVTALDCFYPKKLKVDLVERYFLGFRKLVYQHISFKETAGENLVEVIADQKIKKSEENTSVGLMKPEKKQVQEMSGLPDLDQGNDGLPVEGPQVKAKKRKRSSKNSSETISGLSNPEGSKVKVVPVGTEDLASYNCSQQMDPVITSDLADSNGNLEVGKANIKKMARKKGSNAIVLTSDFDYSKLKINGQAQGTALLLKFSTESPLPSKEALVSAFSGFGEMIESETHVLNESLSAQVVFINNSDAKTAFCSLAKISPFGSALVNYRLLELSAVSTVSEADLYLRAPQLQKPKQKPDQKLKPKPKPDHKLKLSPPKPKTTLPVKPGLVPVGPPAMQGSTAVVELKKEVPDMATVKKKLERMRAMMDQAGDTLPAETRAKLDTEIKGLLAKVSSST